VLRDTAHLLQTESKTLNTHDELIRSLTYDLRPIAPNSAKVQLTGATVAGGVVAFAILLFALGIQPELTSPTHAVPLLVKFAFAGSLAIAAWQYVVLESRPDRHSEKILNWVMVPLVGLSLVALGELTQHPAAQGLSSVMGSSWFACPARILGFSIPIFAALAHAMRKQAPTNLRAAGGALGLLSGAVAASIYALACAESSAGFVLVWYSAGIGLATLAGALAGPWLLKW
jgi:hypothetical protein